MSPMNPRLMRPIANRVTAVAKDSSGNVVQPVAYTEEGVDYLAHIFNASGTLQFLRAVDVEYLIVAGGGGGGRSGAQGASGGGGAGGMLTNAGTPTPVSKGSYTITVGAGGGGSTVSLTAGSSGSNSSALSFSASGGGGGGTAAGLNGGSGGGGGASASAGSSGGIGTSGQGSDGGTAANATGAGGGGKGGAGGNATANDGNGGSGGSGQSNAMSGSSVSYAGGGAGGSRSGTGGSASAGGGAGGSGASGAGVGAIQNTGGGGGGSGGLGNGGNGGSGIVIVRYRRAAADVTYDSDALAYIQAVQSADNAGLEPAVRDAINDFVVGCKADGIWTAIKASCILMGARTLSGALTPLVGTAPTNNGPFVSGDYNRETGLVGNGSTKYLNSNRASNADPQDNVHLSVYVSAAATNATRGMIGDTSSSVNGQTIINGVNDGSLYTQARLTAGAGSANASGQGNTTGFKGVRRNVSSEIVRLSGGVAETITVNVTSAAPTSENYAVFARTPSSPALHSADRFAFYSIGESLDLALLDTRVTTLYNAIGAAI